MCHLNETQFLSKIINYYSGHPVDSNSNLDRLTQASRVQYAYFVSTFT